MLQALEQSDGKRVTGPDAPAVPRLAWKVGALGLLLLAGVVWTQWRTSAPQRPAAEPQRVAQVAAPSTPATVATPAQPPAEPAPPATARIEELPAPAAGPAPMQADAGAAAAPAASATAATAGDAATATAAAAAAAAAAATTTAAPAGTAKSGRDRTSTKPRQAQARGERQLASADRGSKSRAAGKDVSSPPSAITMRGGKPLGAADAGSAVAATAAATDAPRNGRADADVEIVSALMTHLGSPSANTATRSRPAADAGNGGSAVARAGVPDNIADLVATCRAGSSRQQTLACRWRICKGYWGKAEACPASERKAAQRAARELQAADRSADS